MAKMVSKQTYVNNTKDILINKGSATIVNCQINNTNVSTTDGKKIIPAGTPIGGTTSLVNNPNAVLSVSNTSTLGANTQGILLDPVDVTDGNGNGHLVIRGTIDYSKCPTFDASVITALKGSITLVNGGK